MKKYTIQEVAKLLADKTHAVYDDGNTTLDVLVKILKLAFPKDEETDTFEFAKEDPYYGYCRHDSDNWANIGRYLEQLEIINLSDVLNDNEMLIYDIKVNGYSMFDKFIKTGRIQSQGNKSYFDLGSKDSMQVETVTISKEDYDYFLKLEETVKNYIPNVAYFEKDSRTKEPIVSFENVLTRHDLNDLKAKSKINSDLEKAKKSDQKFLDKCAIACINAFISSENQMTKFQGGFKQVDKDLSYTCYRLAKAMLKQRNKIKNR